MYRLLSMFLSGTFIISPLRTVPASSFSFPLTSVTVLPWILQLPRQATTKLQVSWRLGPYGAHFCIHWKNTTNREYSVNVCRRRDGRKMEEKDCTTLINIHLVETFHPENEIFWIFYFLISQSLNYAVFLTCTPHFPGVRMQQRAVEYLLGGGCPGWTDSLILSENYQFPSFYCVILFHCSDVLHGKNNTYFAL